nr:ORF3 [Torque teno felis virus]
MKALFPKLQDQTLLKPENILKGDLKTPQTSCPGTSTQTGSSKRQLLSELLNLITMLNEDDWKTKDELNISLDSSTTSSQSTTSSDMSDWEIHPHSPLKGAHHPTDGPRPPTPKKKPIPIRKLKKHLRYEPF